MANSYDKSRVIISIACFHHTVKCMMYFSIEVELALVKVCLFCSQVTVVVLGNKTDLRERRQVDQEVAQQWARSEKVKLWEVSVTERNSLIEPFTQLTSRLTQPQSKSSFPLPGRKSKGTPANDI